MPRSNKDPLSGGFGPNSLKIDVNNIGKYGINCQISACAYDPVQSLLAVGTKFSRKFGPGQVYIFGKDRVQVTLSLSTPSASVRVLQFAFDKLLCIDSADILYSFSLPTSNSIGLAGKRKLSTYIVPGKVSSLASDPLLDYTFIGLVAGDIMCYDLDRESPTPFRIPNQWGSNPRDAAARNPVISMQLHPRDIGTLLIGYASGAVVYSLKQQMAVKFLMYELPPNAPGGNPDPTRIKGTRRPALVQALWHPQGTFILTVHDDGSLVFWDPTTDNESQNKPARIIQARTITNVNVNRPGSGRINPNNSVTNRLLISKISWCANADPNDTSILIAGGLSADIPDKGLTLLELGPTPNFATSGWDALSAYFENPVRTRTLPTPPNANIVDFCLIPKMSPHYAGAWDPIAVLTVNQVGEVFTISFPAAFPVTPTNQLPLSMLYVHPFPTHIDVTSVDPAHWGSMIEQREPTMVMDRNMPPRELQILAGGMEKKKMGRRGNRRHIVQTAHEDGTVRLWDAGQTDEIENPTVVQVDVVRALGRLENVAASRTAFSSFGREFAVGMEGGEIIIFKWGRNTMEGQDLSPVTGPNQPGVLTDIRDRCDPALAFGMIPFALVNVGAGKITAITATSANGFAFVAAASQNGNLVVIDTRIPAIIHNNAISKIVATQPKKTKSKKSVNYNRPDYATCLEFSIMTLDNAGSGQQFSTINLHVGTAQGNVLTFKILPRSREPGFSIEFAGWTLVEGAVVHLHPIVARTGSSAHADYQSFERLRSGNSTDGLLVAVSSVEIQVFKPPAERAYHRAYDGTECLRAGMLKIGSGSAEDPYQHAVAGLFRDQSVRLFSLTSLKEITRTQIGNILNYEERIREAVFTSKCLFGWIGPAELGVIELFGEDVVYVTKFLHFFTCAVRLIIVT